MAAYAPAYEVTDKLLGLSDDQSLVNLRLKMLWYTIRFRFGKYIFRLLSCLRSVSIRPLLSSAYDHLILVYEFEGKAVGIVIFAQVNPDVWELRDIAVNPAFQNKGIGAKLLAVGISRIRKLKAKRVFLSVRARNDPAVSLYEKLGFEVYDVGYIMKPEL